MLSLRGMLTRIIHFFERVSQCFHSPASITPPSLTFCSLNATHWRSLGQNANKIWCVIGKFAVNQLHWYQLPFQLLLYIRKKGISSCGALDYAGGALWSPFLHFFWKKVLIYFRCLEECCNAGLLWSSKKKKKKKKNPFTVQFCPPPGLNLPGKWRLTGEQSSWQSGTISIFFHISILD